MVTVEFWVDSEIDSGLVGSDVGKSVCLIVARNFAVAGDPMKDQLVVQCFHQEFHLPPAMVDDFYMVFGL